MSLRCLEGILHHNCFNLGCYSCPVKLTSGFLPECQRVLSRGLVLQHTEFRNETVVTCIFHLGVRGAVRRDLDVK